MSNRRKPRAAEPPSPFVPAVNPLLLAAAANERASQVLRLRESAATLERPTEPTAEPTTPQRITITEARGGISELTGATQLAQLIDAGWGSSGFYSPQVLEAAARSRIFAQGTPMFLDHPTASEEHDRPERSVRDIAAYLAEDARYDPDRKALVARVKVYPHAQPLVTSLAEHVGLSIRADGMAEMGEAEGRTGPIVTQLTKAMSVDYVTQAGRGGKVLALLESARSMTLAEAGSLGGWLESRLHLCLTQYADDMYGDGRLTRDERITLSAAIGEGLQAWTARVEADAPQLFTRDLYEDPQQQVAVAEADPAQPPAEPETTGEAEPTPNEKEPGMSGTETGDMPAQTSPEPGGLSHEARAEIAEAQLRESQARITVLESQTAALAVERDTARGEVRRIRNVEAARGAVQSALAAHQDLPAAARTRIAESLTVTPPTTDAGDVDTSALQVSVTRAVEGERAYIASIRESAGEGTPTGLGSSAPVADVGAWQSDVTARFGRLGLNESAAAAAARR